jgi:hypothetical protein
MCNLKSFADLLAGAAWPSISLLGLIETDGTMRQKWEMRCKRAGMENYTTLFFILPIIFYIFKTAIIFFLID